MDAISMAYTFVDKYKNDHVFYENKWISFIR